MGLLHLGEYLLPYNYQIEYLDLLDRHHPAWEAVDSHPFPDGRGHFHKEEINKPAILKAIPRKFSRYGAPKNKVLEYLESTVAPDVILLTSHMTYWYGGVKETANLLRKRFPNVPLILGGIYATLMPEHAQRTIQPDDLISGAGEMQILAWLNRYFQRNDPPKPLRFGTGNMMRWYPGSEYYPLLTSRGCPYHCSFCATRLLNDTFIQYSPEAVIAELSAAAAAGFRHFVFYDDALFTHKKHHIIPILKEIHDRVGELQFHSPNGLFAREIDEETAQIMAKARFINPRLSLETISPSRLNDISGKVNQKQFTEAICNLNRAGYKAGEYTAYLMMGLPGQHRGEVMETIDFAIHLGAKVSLSSFSPIPGTVEWERCGLPDNIDPLLLNNTVFPWSKGRDDAAEMQSIRLYAKNENEKISRQKFIMNEENSDVTYY